MKHTRTVRIESPHDLHKLTGKAVQSIAVMGVGALDGSLDGLMPFAGSLVSLSVFDTEVRDVSALVALTKLERLVLSCPQARSDAHPTYEAAHCLTRPT